MSSPLTLTVLGDHQCSPNQTRPMSVLRTPLNLEMQNREAFLRDAARRFNRISSKAIAAISETYRANQDRLISTIHALLVLSLLLTASLWFFVTRFFERFLISQKQAIESIKAADYDYDVSPVSSDELGDLAEFIKELALNLKASEAFFAGALNNLPSFVFVLEPDGTLVFANESALQAASLEWDEIKGTKFYDAYWIVPANEEREATKACVARCAAGETVVCETRWRVADETLIWVDFRLHPIFDEGSKVKYLIPECTDISERKRVETELRLAATAFDTHEAILITDRDHNIVRVNRAFTQITGYSEQEVVGRNPRLMLSDDQDEAVYRQTWDALKETDNWSGEIWNRRKNGERYPVWATVTVVKNSHDAVTHFVGTLIDLSELKHQQQTIERKAAEERALGELLHLSLEPSPLEDYLQRTLNTLLDSVPWLSILPKGGIFLNERKGRGGCLTLIVSRGLDPQLNVLCARVPFGECLCGKAASARKIQYSADCDDDRHEIRYDGMPPHGHYNIPILRSDTVLGVVVTYLPHGHPFNKNDEAFLYQVADVLSMGISRRWAEAEIHHQALHDSLTDLPNRHLLMNHLQMALARARRHGHFGGVLFIELDHFKTINDSLGHPIGDALLEEVAKRLTEDLRQEDMAARLGGDEFIMLLSEMSDNKDATARNVQVTAEKVRDVLSLPYSVTDHELHVTPSIGIALFPMGQESPDDILKKADTAMYRAKEAGRNTIRYFLPSMQRAAEARLRVQNDLRKALKRNELRLYFQPQVDESGRLLRSRGTRALATPDRGLIMPGDFIPLAEDTGQILDVGEWVIRAACDQLRVWKDQDSTLYLAVNVSPVQFSQGDFAMQVESILADTGADPRLLKLEFTESVLLDNLEGAIEKMGALSKLGIRFSIDDFGTGYSSLAYLKRLPLDEIKIDRSFIRDITTDPSDANLVETIISMASRLGLKVVAEGVETAEQLQFLMDSGSRNFQGYLFSRPLPVEDFDVLLERKKRHALSTPRESIGSLVIISGPR